MYGYVILFFAVALLTFIESKRNDATSRLAVHIALFLTLNFFISASTSRGDYDSYYDFYTDIDINSPQQVFEIGFFWLSYLIKLTLGNSPGWLFVITAFITISLKFYILSEIDKYSDKKINFSLYFLIYISLCLVYLDIGSIRFSIATSFVFLSLTFLHRDKHLKFIATIFFATLFHASALAALPLFLIKKFKAEKLTFIIYGCLGALLFASSSFQSYLELDYYTSKIIGYARYGSITFSFQTLHILLAFIAFTAFHKKEITGRNGLIYSIWLFSLYSICLAMLFAINQLTVSRYLLMFSTVEPLLIIAAINKINGKYKPSVIAIGTLLLIPVFIYSLANNSDDINLYLPYKNWLIDNIF